ncbi:MAG: efflux RND transporter periplasmic adaptor subunit [Dokdonella sp.]
MSRWKLALLILVLVVAGVIGWRVWQSYAAQGQGRPGGRAGDASDAPIPVTVMPVEQKDVPVYLTSLGTVQALNTVTINAQVSGQIQTINFKEGQEVKAGDVIAQIDPRTFQAALDQAVAKQKQDAAQLSASASTLRRYQDLIKQHFVAAQDLENQLQTVAQQQALVAADAAAVASARVQLGYTRIVAPINGIAGIRQVDVGNLVTANASTGFVVLTQVHPINVIFTLPEQNLEEVRSGQTESPLAVTALDRTDSHVIAEGELKVIDNQIDTATGTFKLKSEFSNEKNTLWPGQFVNVRVRTKTMKGGLVVPATSVQRGPDGSYVYALQADGTVAMKPITLIGDAGDDGTLIGGGVAAGDRVVTEGQFRLKPGSKVQALAPGEAPPATSAEELAKLKQQDKSQPQRRGGGRRGG